MRRTGRQRARPHERGQARIAASMMELLRCALQRGQHVVMCQRRSKPLHRPRSCASIGAFLLANTRWRSDGDMLVALLARVFGCTALVLSGRRQVHKCLCFDGCHIRKTGPANGEFWTCCLPGPWPSQGHCTFCDASRLCVLCNSQGDPCVA